MENRLRRGLQLGIAEEGVTSIRITVEAREVGAGDVDTEAMARVQHHARRPQVDSVFIDHARRDEAGFARESR
jgi:hypothetical protein